MGKWKKRLRKFAKKAIPVIGLGLAATALARKRKAVDTGTLSGKAGYEGNVPSPKRYVNPNEETLAAGTKNWIAKKPVEKDKKHWWNDAPWPKMAKGGRVGVGKAKRGFSKLLRKK